MGRKDETRGKAPEGIAADGQHQNEKCEGQYENFANRVKTVLNMTNTLRRAALGLRF